MFVRSYNTFCGYPPEIVKKMPKKDLAEEVSTSAQPSHSVFAYP